MSKMKTLAVAVVTVAALMTTIGAGTASATETSFCKMKETFFDVPVCTNMYKSGQEVHGVLESGQIAVIETGIGKVECAESTFGFFSEKQTSKPLGAIVSGFTFTECGPYTVKVSLNTVDIEIIDLPVWTHNGTITATSGVVEVKKGGAECKYSISHIGILTGGKPATIDLTGVLTTIGGVGCLVANGKWTTNYSDTTSEELWVSM
jgi:hypothetical protein